jgi:hypothetical protein
MSASGRDSVRVTAVSEIRGPSFETITAFPVVHFPPVNFSISAASELALFLA